MKTSELLECHVNWFFSSVNFILRYEQFPAVALPFVYHTHFLMCSILTSIAHDSMGAGFGEKWILDFRLTQPKCGIRIEGHEK